MIDYPHADDLRALDGLTIIPVGQGTHALSIPAGVYRI